MPSTLSSSAALCSPLAAQKGNQRFAIAEGDEAEPPPRFGDTNCRGGKTAPHPASPMP